MKIFTLTKLHLTDFGTISAKVIGRTVYCWRNPRDISDPLWASTVFRNPSSSALSLSISDGITVWTGNGAWTQSIWVKTQLELYLLDNFLVSFSSSDRSQCKFLNVLLNVYFHCRLLLNNYKEKGSMTKTAAEQMCAMFILHFQMFAVWTLRILKQSQWNVSIVS